MLDLDGSGGGGQLLRTALSLSTITDTPFRIDDVRRTRPNPGLRPQHLAGVDLVARLCDADVSGAEFESDSLVFRPGDARRSTLDADIGTAGSLTLLFDAVLPIASIDEDPFELTATGGTDVRWAPTVDYYRWVKLPLLANCGLDASVDLERTGFYPAGGGRATLWTTPSPLSPFELTTRGGLERVDIYSKAAEALAERKRDLLAANARLLAEFVEASPAVSGTVPSGSSFAFLGHELVDGDELVTAAGDEGVLVVPGRFFGDPQRVRVSLGHAPEEMETALATLAAVAARLG